MAGESHVIVVALLCLSGQEMAPTGQRPLLKDSWCQNSILWEEQFAVPTIAFITWRQPDKGLC